MGSIYGLDFSDLDNVALDEDDMISDSDRHIPTQQSTKAYRDAITASNSVYVKSLSDFPAVVGGKIPLAINTTYFIYASVNIGTTPFLIPDDATSNINFMGQSFNSVTLIYTGSAVMFEEAGDIAFFNIFDLILANTGSGTLINPTPSPNPIAQVAIFNTLVTGFSSLGTWGVRPVILECAFVDNTDGFILNDIIDIRIDNCLMINTSDLGTVFITIGASGLTTGSIINVTFTLLAGETGIDIKNTLATTSLIRVENNAFSGAGTPLEATGLSTKSVSIFSQGNDGIADSRFIGSFIAQGNDVATVITTQGAGESNYVDLDLGEATGSITAYATNGSGGTTVTSSSHGEPDEKLVEITGSTSYNGKFEIFNVLTNSFDIGRAFVADDATGTWTAGAFADDDIERWQLNDASNGELEYIGQQPFSGEFFAVIASKAVGGAAKRFKFRIVKNSVDGFAMPNEIKNTITETTFRKGVTAVQGDVFKLQVANFENAANIIIDTISVGVK